MIEIIFYFLLIILLGYLYFRIEKDLAKRYGKNLNLGGIGAIAQIVAPWFFFKKKFFWTDYLKFIFQLVCLLGMIYFVFKLVNLLW